MYAYRAITFFVLALLSPSIWPSDTENNSVESKVNRALGQINKALTADSIKQVPATSLWEVETSAGEILYFTDEMNFLLSGRLIDITSMPYTDVTEARHAERRRIALEKVDRNSLITFPGDPESAVHHQVFVFTDVSCGYCVQFHRNIESINAAGITVHYLAYPRSGLNSAPASLMERAWCAPDQQTALTEAKSEGKVSQHPLPCQSPIQAHMRLAQSFSATGTPAIFDSAGKLLGGYLDIEQLLNALK